MELVCKPMMVHKRHMKEHTRHKIIFCVFWWLMVITANAAQTCLPTGVCLEPTGSSFDVGNMPLAMVLSPEGDRLVISLSGWRQQGLQVIDRHHGTVLQTISQPSAFL